MAENVIIRILLGFSERKSSTAYKIVSLLLGTAVFLLIIPAAFLYVGGYIEGLIRINWDHQTSIVIACASIAIGSFFLVWSVITQWMFGKGTPLPVTPTQKLITSGPYKLCRNPIELGTVLYYFGIVTFFSGLTAGIATFLIALVFFSPYHKFIEEKELEIRFGDEYVRYRDKTPFIIPKLWS